MRLDETRPISGPFTWSRRRRQPSPLPEAEEKRRTPTAVERAHAPVPVALAGYNPRRGARFYGWSS